MPTPVNQNEYLQGRWTSLVSAVILMGADRAVAEDVAQEAMARLWVHWDDVAPDRRDAWLYRVAFNLNASWWRSRSRELRAFRRSADAVRAAADDPAAGVAAATRDLLASVPRRQREALVRFYVLDQSIADISDAMRCAEGTVRSHLARGLLAARQDGAPSTLRPEPEVHPT